MVNFDGLEEPCDYDPYHVVGEGIEVRDLNGSMMDREDFMFLDQHNVEPPFYADDYMALTKGITDIDCTKDDPSKLFVFGKKSFAVTMDKKMESASIAATRYGDVSIST